MKPDKSRESGKKGENFLPDFKLLPEFQAHFRQIRENDITEQKK